MGIHTGPDMSFRYEQFTMKLNDRALPTVSRFLKFNFKAKVPKRVKQTNRSRRKDDKLITTEKITKCFISKRILFVLAQITKFTNNKQKNKKYINKTITNDETILNQF